MSRTVGPYKDVETARVEGAYELCEGVDETGRAVHILTLGTSSARDPARRGLLSDTVAWAYATAGPDDAPILVADLEGEQPYVVVLRDPRLRGADRIMERLLSLGPASGPLPAGSAPHRPQAPASPAGPPSAPPMSPAVAIPPPKRRSQVRPILIGIASVVVMTALVVGGWIIWTALASGDGDGSSAPAADERESAVGEEAPEDAAAEEAQVPEWDPEASDVALAGEPFGESADTKVVAYEGWPFAFRTPADYECARDEASTECSSAGGDSTVLVAWSVCEGDCGEAAREELRRQLPYQPMQLLENGDAAFSVRTPYGEWKASLSVFLPGGEETLHVTAVIEADQERAGEVQPVLNDVFNQAWSLPRE
ncbi:hypothetical protein [Glycomyces xiaoerkulensis]|uniref:hypothetical protein n=1 Tax=Glycomyces xiaoerkulensis TaxID=2038139 RepID=UPI000C257DA4|nr:hypothetical protein [Glycomyces xiaoerkulensis]